MDIFQMYGIAKPTMRQRDERMTPEEEKQVTESLGQKALGTVGAVGNSLDLPGSVVRDLATWLPGGMKAQNPFDQLLTPFNDSNRVSGRDLNRSYGLAGKQDNWANFAGGMGTEIALDPLTYLTFGGSALGKGGQVAKSAGLLKKAPEVLARRTGRNLAEVGAREARVGLSLRELLGELGPEATKAAEIAAKGKKLNLDDLLDQKLGGNVGINLPFMDPSFTVGGSTKAAAAVDKFARDMRYMTIPGTDFAPINALMNQFQVKTGGMATPLGAKLAEKAFDAKTRNRSQVDLVINKYANQLKDLGYDSATGGRMLRRMMEVEGLRKNAPAEMMPMLDEMRSVLEEMPAIAKDWGINLKEFVDDDLSYFPRQYTREVRNAKGADSARVLNGRQINAARRKEFLRGDGLETESIIKLGQDEDINAAIANGAKASEIADMIKSKYGSEIPEKYKVIAKTGENAGKEVERDRYKALARWLGTLSPEGRKSGIFGNHALYDLQARMVSAGDAKVAAETVVDFLTQPDFINKQSKKAKGGILKETPDGLDKQGMVTVNQVLKRTGLNIGDSTGGIGKQIAIKLGHDLSQLTPEQANKVIASIGKASIDGKVADEITRFVESFKSPDQASQLLDLVNGASNLWKGALTTPWPSFHVRNLISGQWANASAGLWSADSVKDAVTLTRGGVVKGAKDIPAVQAEWAKRQGLPSSGSSAMLADDAQGGFYSKLSEAVASKVGGKTDWGQFKATMKGAGVKDEEIDDLGLEKFFAGGRRTKEEIQEYINDWKPEIKIIDKKGKKTHYSQYSIPGGEPGSYREMLITAKSRNAKALDLVKQRNALAYDLHEKYGDGYLNEGVMNADDAARFSAAQKKADSVDGIDSYNEYASPHWREKNVVAHLRMDDIKNPDGTKTLRVTEIQSDWHQDGKKHGYYTESDATGPFKKSWSRLAFKQALKTAVEEGYDSVALVVGSDAAKAVGGPVKQMDEAYNIMLKDAKEYTKKYGSYSGETKAQGTVNANAGKPEIGLSFASFNRDNIARAFVPWSNDAPVGFIKKNEVLDPYEIIPAHFSLPEQHAMQRAQGEMRRRIEQGLPAHPDRFEVYKIGPNGDELIGKFGSQEEARFALAEATGHTTNNSFDGGMHVFKITDEMRRDILGKGQPRYMLDANDWFPQWFQEQMDNPLARDMTSSASVSDSVPDVWHPESFSKLSAHHKIFNDKLVRLQNDGALKNTDADILRLAFSGASEEGLSRLNMANMEAADSILTKGGQKAAGKWSWQVGDNGLLEFNIQVAKNLPQNQSSLSVLLHELGHQAHWSYKQIPGNELGGEFQKLIFKSKKNNRLLEHMKGVHGERLGEYLATTFDEQFPQLFADSILRRKVPQGALGKIITNVRDWIVQFLERIKLTKPLPKPTQSRMDEIIDALMGFDGSSMEKLSQKDAAKSMQKMQKLSEKYGEQYMMKAPQLTDEEATKILGEMASAYRVVGKFDASDTVGLGSKIDNQVAHNLDDMISGIPGDGRKSFSVTRTAKKAAGLEQGTSPWKFWANRGVGGRSKSEFGPMAAGEEVGFATEAMNRLSPWLHQIKKGVDPQHAADTVGAIQVQYSNRYYTKAEQQILGNLFPFYKFSRSMVPYLINQVLEHPGGATANTIRTMENAHDPAQFTPDHVRESAAIPINGSPLEAVLGKVPAGHDRYISGLGLPVEELMGFGPSPRAAGLEVMSRLNPAIKAPIEYFTGQSFFQKTPTGGRPLDTMDPPTGRLLANLSGQKEPVRFPGQTEADILLSNSPFSKVISSLNMATDTRRGPVEKAVNMLTGVRTKDVTPATKDTLERDTLNQAMKEFQAKQFTRTYIPDSVRATMTPEQQRQADLYEQMAALLADRAKARKEAAQAEEQQKLRASR